MVVKLKKLASLLLCAAITLLPLTGFGAGAFEECAQVVYCTEMSREDYHDAALPLETQTGLMSAEGDFLLEAAAQLRAGMVAREPVIEVEVTVSDNSYDTRNLSSDLFKLALAHTGVPNEGDYLSRQWGHWRSGIFQKGNKFTVRFGIDYYTNAEQEAKVDAELERVMSSLGLEGKSDYEKLETIYQWVCGNIIYDYDNVDDVNYVTAHTAYGGLIDRTCVCQGYAVLLYRMLLTVGIDCRDVSGNGHEWNIVELNGEYYDIDATWDAEYSSDAPFHSYPYFLMCESEFSADHTRAAEYTTAEWNAAYPMAGESYPRQPPKVPVQSIDLAEKSIVIRQGESVRLTPTIEPENASNRNVLWNTSYYGDKSVARIAHGVVTGLKPGTSNVFVMSQETGEKIRCSVTVTNERLFPLETNVMDKNGSVTVTANSAVGGYRLYLASYDENGGLVGVASESVENGGETEFCAVPEPGADSAAVMAMNENGAPLMKRAAVFEPIKQLYSSWFSVRPEYFTPLREASGKVTYSFTIRDNGSNDSGIMIGNSSVMNCNSENPFADGSIVILFSNGSLYYRNNESSDKKLVASYKAPANGSSTDIDIMIEADVASQSYDLWANGKCVASNVAFRTKANALNSMLLKENGCGLNFDVINFSQEF